jgi:hypothetical protein
VFAQIVVQVHLTDHLVLLSVVHVQLVRSLLMANLYARNVVQVHTQTPLDSRIAILAIQVPLSDLRVLLFVPVVLVEKCLDLGRLLALVVFLVSTLLESRIVSIVLLEVGVLELLHVRFALLEITTIKQCNRHVSTV